MRRHFSAVALFAALIPAGAAAATATPRSPLPFVVDDYPKALEEARARHVPIFLEAWAPW